ncbi:MAG: hypothetical protein A4E29_01607 [Methanomassiliicoccales archaeon PtaB.Bin134]|jgi:hypothetical protein|nr:MAG: hypothetical protein A4E29_01607 [Methanomassiliicoccales archaeon PtaB.Bin134]
MKMRIGVVACESFRKEMDLLTEGDPDIVHKEYLEFGLHSYPQDLKKAVVEHVNALQGKVDAVFLGFGTCNSLKDVQRDLIIPTVTIEADDCVGALLTNEEYAREKRICAGTMFAIPFISEMGTEYFEKELYSKMPNYEELGVDAQWFLDMLFDGYSRVLLVDTGVGDREDLRSRSREMADRLGLRYEERQGTLQVLRDCLQNAKNLALASARS